MNKWIIAAALLAAGVAQAKQVDKPDDNTLWMEDGKEIETGKLGFHRWTPEQGDKALEIKPKEDGKGFSFFAKDKNGRKVITVVKVSPEYPYLVFRITDFELLNGYRNWTVNTEIGNILYSQVTAPQKGIFVFDLFRNLPEKDAAKKAAYLRFWVYNLRMEFEYIKMVKKPAYVVRAECADPVIRPGSKVKFTAELEKEAEDVSISLIGGRPIKVNGSVKIQLKPVDKTQKIWSAEVEIKSIAIKDNKTLGRHRAIMKMDVLGGDLDEPVWVGLPYPVTP